MLPRVGEDGPHGGPRHGGLGSDGVGADLSQLLEGVGGVSGEQDVAVVVVDADHRYVPGGVTGGVNGDDPAIIGEGSAAPKGSEPTPIERERAEVDIGRQRLSQHPLRQPRPA